MNFLAIIPARYGSTRFPAKALARVEGKSLIQWVWEGTRSSQLIGKVIVATDHPLIQEECQRIGANVVMTSEQHVSGTDRVAEALGTYECDWVVNVQGDEILIQGDILDAWLSQVSKLTPDIGMATLARKITNPVQVLDPSVVKVVSDLRGRALYFSRSPIPHNRDGDVPLEFFHHLGLYVYRPSVLKQLVSLPPSPLELVEKLEQLRALQNGIAIQVMRTGFESIGVDTPEDLERVQDILRQREKA